VTKQHRLGQKGDCETGLGFVLLHLFTKGDTKLLAWAAVLAPHVTCWGMSCKRDWQFDMRHVEECCARSKFWPPLCAVLCWGGKLYGELASWTWRGCWFLHWKGS
jgi:hypothetical protein